MTWTTLLILLAALAVFWTLSQAAGWVADRYHARKERDLDDRIIAELRSRILHGTSATWVGPGRASGTDVTHNRGRQEG